VGCGNRGSVDAEANLWRRSAQKKRASRTDRESWTLPRPAAQDFLRGRSGIDPRTNPSDARAYPTNPAAERQSQGKAAPPYPCGGWPQGAARSDFGTRNSSFAGDRGRVNRQIQGLSFHSSRTKYRHIPANGAASAIISTSMSRTWFWVAGSRLPNWNTWAKTSSL
jgi:hypothetical protein